MTQALQTLDTSTSLTPVSLFKCLADDTRARMILLIAREAELCVCELTTALDESQPKISRHLAQLRQCALLEDERRGQWVYYRLHPDLPEWAVDMVNLVMQANRGWLEINSQRLKQMRVGSDEVGVCTVRSC
jgi:ArsR family transcriptional regulator